MIFVTVGSTQYRFERLMEMLDALPGEDLVVQCGPAKPPPHVSRAVEFLSFQEMLEHFDAADSVVSHAGVGTIIGAIRAGHTPFVVPRLRCFRETVDDHQMKLTEALAADGKVIPVWDAGDLADLVRGAPPRGPAVAPAEGPLHAALRDSLLVGRR